MPRKKKQAEREYDFWDYWSMISEDLELGALDYFISNHLKNLKIYIKRNYISKKLSNSVLVDIFTRLKIIFSILMTTPRENLDDIEKKQLKEIKTLIILILF